MGTTSRRTFLGGAAVIGFGTPYLSLKSAKAGNLTAKQFHNQPASSPLHKALSEFWAKVGKDTDGALEVTVFPQNNGIVGSDPAALKMLQSGELEFYTLMGGILSQAVPAMNVQGLPYVFTSSKQVYRLEGGRLGRYLDSECHSRGIERIRGGLFENGFRQTNTTQKPIATVNDFTDLKIRIPDGEMFRDFFSTIGAKPQTLNINKLYDALKNNEVDGQENPLVIAETNKFYEVTKYMSITNHMWSGFNLLSNLKFWDDLPSSVKRAIAHNLPTYVNKERKATSDLNKSLATTLQDKGLIFSTPDTSSFRKLLAADFYPRWKKQLGAKTWTLLEDGLGRIA